MTERFSGKTVFITGASSGIGAALAVEFAKEGAKLSLAARREDWLDRTLKAVEEVGGRGRVVACDVTKRETLDRAVASTLDAFGSLDVAIANAGFGVNGVFSELTIEDFRRQFETNVFGAINTIHAVLPSLRDSRGHLVLIGSVMGRVGVPVSSAYASSKFAVTGLAESLYYELAEEGIRVTLINPGIVDTNIARVDNRGVFKEGRKDPRPAFFMVPVGKAAREIVKRISQGKAEATITRHGRIIVWLSRHFPGLVRFILRMTTKGRMGEVAKRKRAM